MAHSEKSQSEKEIDIVDNVNDEKCFYSNFFYFFKVIYTSLNNIWFHI